jgi:hypothetical protein
MSQGSHPLTGVAGLANVTVSYPGEHWSDAVASGRAITPGEAVITTSSGGVLAVRPVTAADNGDPRVAIALRTIDTPEQEHPRALGPNEIKNTAMAVGEYVHYYKTGGFNITLVDPRRTYEAGMLIGWDIDGQRPTGKSGEGSWAPNANADVDSVFEIREVRTVGNPASGGGYILKVVSTRSNP